MFDSTHTLPIMLGIIVVLFISIEIIGPLWAIRKQERANPTYQPSVATIPAFTPEPGEQVHSAINVPAIIQQKMAPPPTSTVPPPVQQMTYTFGEPLHDDDHTVRLYLALSQEEAAIVKKKGLNEEPVEKNVSLFSEPDLEEIQYRQELELANVSNPDGRATLRIQHQEQMTILRSSKRDIVLEHLLQYPFEWKCTSRLEATKYQQKLSERLQSLKQRLEKEHV